MERGKHRSFRWLFVVSASFIGMLIVLTGLRASAAALDGVQQSARSTSTPADSAQLFTPPVSGSQLTPNSGQLAHSQFLPLVAYHAGSVTPPFGVQNYYALTPQYGLTRIVESKVSWVRYPIFWGNIESINTTPENYYWGDADTSLLALSNTQVNLVVTLVGNPDWAAPPSMAR